MKTKTVKNNSGYNNFNNLHKNVSMMVVVRLVCGWAVVGMWLVHGGWWYVCSCQYVFGNMISMWSVCGWWYVCGQSVKLFCYRDYTVPQTL